MVQEGRRINKNRPLRFCGEQCDKALANDPQNANAWAIKGSGYSYLGRLNKSTGKFKKANQCFDKALEIDTQNFYAWYCKGEMFSILGHLREATECYNIGKRSIRRHSNMCMRFMQET